MDRAPHPWNTRFTWCDHAGPFTTVTSEQARAFDRDGFFVVEDAFGALTLAELDAELAAGDENVKQLLGAVPGVGPAVRLYWDQSVYKQPHERR